MAASSAPTEAANSRPPNSVVRVAIAWLLCLLAFVSIYEVSDPFRDLFPSHLGRLPVGVVWFGAIGGSLASLTGIFWHHRTWDHGYDLWHKLRPVTGLVMGSLGAFFLLVTTETATATGGAAGASHVSGAAPGSPLAINPDIYYVAAFLTGFAEAAFRALVKRLTDTIVGPGKSEAKTDDNSHH